MKQNKSILITADIDESLYEDLSKDNIVEKHGFINIDFNKNLNWHFSIEKAIFTSKNAVLSLLENGNYGNIKKVYCVGEKTKALLEENGFNVVLNENYSEKLAIELIKSVGTDKIVYFCGNKRKKHIENTLDPKKIDIVEAYKNSVNPKFYKKSFDYVLFSSPSAVISYISISNSVKSIAVCIGDSTGDEAKKYFKNILISDQSTFEGLINFTKKHINE